MSDFVLKSGVTSTGLVTRPGFYGKLPSLGDFVSRRLDTAFIDAWDRWLDAAIKRSREQLGDAWISAYQVCPVWRFVLGPGLAGATSFAGVMMPSIDRVGRHFPLALAAPIPDEVAPTRLPMEAEFWFDRLQALALTALEDGFDKAAFERQLDGLALDLPLEDVLDRSGGGIGAGWRLHLKPDHHPAAGYPALLDALLRSVASHYSLWWVMPPAGGEAALLVCAGLPPVDGFSALLDGQWVRWGWSVPTPRPFPTAGGGLP